MPPYPVSKTTLSPPPLLDLAPIIQSALLSNFTHATVEVQPCPDLTQPPYHLAAPGLCGNPRIADIGGQRHLFPSPQLSKKYSLLEMTTLMEMSRERGFILGAGAGPFHVVGVNSELMPNLSWEGEEVRNLTRYARIDEGGGCVCERITEGLGKGSVDCGLMANLFGSDGAPGEVLKIIARTRTGDKNFTDTIRDALKDVYGERLVSMGGVFVIRKGKAKLHVMPDFPDAPFKDRGDVERWLRYFEMEAPLVCLSVFHSCDSGLELRMEHTHCFKEGGRDGGHYHDDTTPEEVEYEAYFNVAEMLYRIDRPEV
jgi:hypothetical protein